MTDEEIRATVARMNLTDANRAILLRKALAGDPASRFVVYANRNRKGEGS